MHIAVIYFKSYKKTCFGAIFCCHICVVTSVVFCDNCCRWCHVALKGFTLVSLMTWDWAPAHCWHSDSVEGSHVRWVIQQSVWHITMKMFLVDFLFLPLPLMHLFKTSFSSFLMSPNLTEFDKLQRTAENWSSRSIIPPTLKSLSKERCGRCTCKLCIFTNHNLFFFVTSTTLYYKN